MEDEKREHDAKLKKMETEMEQVFEKKVKEKKQKLKDSEIAVSSKMFLYLQFIIRFCSFIIINVVFFFFLLNSCNKKMNKC